MPGFDTELVRVRAPATSANLGPGFDTFGLALTLFDDIVVRAAGSGLDVAVDGEGAAHVSRDESHLVVRAMRATFDELGGQPPGIAVRCVNRVPHGRGLGSSAAAIVGGIIAARTLVEGGQAALDDHGVFTLAAELEGHPDNVAACLHGGFTITWHDESGPKVVRLRPAPAILVALVPQHSLATHEARRLLPERVPHRDAAYNAARAALFVVAITGRLDVLLPATDDRLHQTYRAPAMPETAELVARLRDYGIPAVISGAGPTVLAIPPDVQRVKKIVTDRRWTIYELEVDEEGARVVPPNQDAKRLFAGGRGNVSGVGECYAQGQPDA